MEQENVQIITPKEVEQLIQEGKSVSIIDVREDEEVASGKIHEAKHIRLMEIPDRLSEISKEQEHILVCRSGRRSENACFFLRDQGYIVKNMIGGMLEWEGDTD